jgi:hypothetical protein
MMFSAAVTFGTFGRQLAIATDSYFDEGVNCRHPPGACGPTMLLI